MLNMRRGTLLLFPLIFFIFSANVIAVNPHISKQTITDSTQSTPHAPNKIISSPKITNSSPDIEIALYTRWLALFTLALVIVAAIQLIFLFKTDKTSRIAAEAAKKSADVSEKALVDLEGPFLYPVIETENMLHSLRNGQMYDPPFTTELSIRIRIKNLGRSAAFPGVIFCMLHTGEADDPIKDSQFGYLVESMISSGVSLPLNFGYRRSSG
jgi:hypothetical protein